MIKSLKFNQYKDVIGNFKFKNILVIGDIIYDKYLYGKVDKISMDAPVPVVNLKDKYTDYIGGAGNVSNTITKLGAKSALLSIYTQDKEGKDLETLLRTTEVDNLSINNSEDRKTSSKTRVLTSVLKTYQQAIRLDREDTHALNTEEENELIAIFDSCFERYDAVMLQNYGKGILTDKFVKHIINKCNSKHITTFIDPKKEDFSKYINCTMIKPNISEAEYFVKYKIDSEDKLKKATKDIFNFTKSKIVIITLGEKGIFAYDGKNSYMSHIVSNAPIDVTGAGEAAISIFLLSYISNHNLEMATDLASISASISVEHLGLKVVSSDDVYRRIIQINNGYLQNS